VTIADSSGSVISDSAIANRYTYTGREWDEGLSLYHYRARMYDAVSGRFVSSDPIGFEGSKWNLFEFLSSCPLINTDPSGNGPQRNYGLGGENLYVGVVTCVRVYVSDTMFCFVTFGKCKNYAGCSNCRGITSGFYTVVGAPCTLVCAFSCRQFEKGLKYGDIGE